MVLRSELLAFGATFILSFLVALATPGCGSEDPDCGCRATPERPEPQGPLSGLDVVGFDAHGEYADLVVAPAEGTIEVTGDTVVIRYRQEAVEHTVVYDVASP